MRLLRALGGALPWIVASLTGLVAVVLCLTLILLPVGIPLLTWSGRLFGQAIRMFMPPEAAHPLKESAKSSKKAVGKARDSVPGLTDFDAGKARKRLNKGWKKSWKKVAKA